MMMLDNYALAFVLLFFISSAVVYSQDACGNTTPSPDDDQQPCIRDIIIAIDGTPYMKNKTMVLAEIDFIDRMISNWTFGDNGVNVAFMSFGFNGQLAINVFYNNLAEAKIALNSIKLGITTLNPTLFTSMVRFVDKAYTVVYPPRPGIEPRFIVFTATTNISDIADSVPYFLNLFNKNYDTVINVVFADPQLYVNIKSLKVIDMLEFLPQYSQNISDTIWDTLCTHDIRFTPQPCTTTTAPPSTTPGLPTTTTTKIIPTLPPATTISPVGTTTASSGGPTGGQGECRCNPKHLWLDIVIVMDVSQSIRNEGLTQLKAHIDTLFGNYMTIDPNQNQTVRVGFISIAETAKIEADFNDIKSLDDLESFLYNIPLRETEKEINIQQGLQKASDIFNSEGIKRNSTRKVVILYTSAFHIDGFNDPRPSARNLLESGVHIIGVKYNIFDEAGFIDDLSTITSPNMTFSNDFTFNPFNNANLMNVTIEALCWINCFCLNNWNERKNPFTTSPKYGQCLYAADIDAGWTPAEKSCLGMLKNMDEASSSMSFAKDYDKFEYYIDMFSKLSTTSGKLNFHVGILYNKSLSAYQYSDGSLITQGDYIPWTNGYPKVSQGTCVAALQGRGFNVSYINVDCYDYFARYVCEVIPCDTENYCPKIDIK